MNGNQPSKYRMHEKERNMREREKIQAKMENVTLWQERQLVGKRKHIYFLYLLMCQLLYIHDLSLFPHQHYRGETLSPFYCWEK